MSSTTYFVHGPNGLQEQQNPDGSWESVVTDGLGNIRNMMDTDLNVLESRQYDPFGEPYGATGEVQTPFGFTGEMADSNGLVYLRARYYNPTTGTFLSPDPLEGQLDRPMSLNRYSYVQGNPVNRVDPSGMCPQPASSYAPPNIAQTLQAAVQATNSDALRRVVEAINSGCVSTMQMPGTRPYADAQLQQNCNCLQEALLYGLERFWQCIQRCSPQATATPQPTVSGTPSSDTLIHTTVPDIIPVTDGCATIRAAGFDEPPCAPGSNGTRVARIEARDCNASCTRCSEWKTVREARFPCGADCNSTRYPCWP